jgi:hypothetical protein
MELLTEPKAACIVVLPGTTPVARPLTVIVATAVFVEVQVTELVRFCVLPSLKVPVAVNCCVVPAAIEEFAGVTASDANVGAVIVTVTLLEGTSKFPLSSTARLRIITVAAAFGVQE